MIVVVEEVTHPREARSAPRATGRKRNRSASRYSQSTKKNAAKSIVSQALRPGRVTRVGSGRVGSFIDFLQTLNCKHASRAKTERKTKTKTKTETKTETTRNARMREQGIAVVEEATHPREARITPLATGRKRN